MFKITHHKVLFSFIILSFLSIFILWQIIFFKKVSGTKLLCKDCNVILISLDTLRAKSLPCYGYEKNTAPNLCEFAKRSYLFQNAYSQSALTLDSNFSIFTSLYPSSHKMTIPFVSNLSNDIVTMPQLFRQNGFKTLYIGPSLSVHIPLDKGIARGFDKFIFDIAPDAWPSIIKENLTTSSKRSFISFYTDYVHEPYLPLNENISKFYDGTAKPLVKWNEWRDKIKEKIRIINSEYCRKFYDKKDNDSCDIKEYNTLYKSQTNTYWDYFKGMDIEEEKKFVQALYEAEIYELDLKLGKFLAELDQEKLLDKTIVIITSQHGESFYEHGKWTHGYNLYNEVIRVPLIIYVPDAKPQVIEKLSESIDIAPSLLYLLGIEPPKQFMGMNLFSPQESEAVISEHFANSKYAVLTKDWKLIINKDNKDGKVTKELYDLNKDYGETVNLIEKKTEIVSSLEKSLNSILSIQPVYEQKNNQPFPTWINEDERKKLIETGYF